MYYLKSEASFDAAHFLKGYHGKCSNLHGHRWRVLAEICGENLSQHRQTRGMLVDFGDLKQWIKEHCDALDHSLIYEKGSLREKTLEALEEEGFAMNEVTFRPTAENFAEYFYREMKAAGFPVHRVEVYETPNNVAAYEE
jgi:6-pyruvoyltetrahydropterin/6-carboxytetrahydropterin synthase